MTKAAKSYIAPEIESLAVPIADLTLWPGNPRQGDVGALSQSLNRFGQVRPILVQKSTMRIVAGNHLYRAAAALGWDRIACIVTEMSDKQAKGFVAADNRTSELGSFDNDLLAVLLADIARNDTLEGTGYDADDLDALLAKVGTVNKSGYGDPDGTKEPPVEPWVKVGQVFALGPHRLACGEPDDPTLSRLLDGEEVDMLVAALPKDTSPVKVATYFGHTEEQFWFRAEQYIDQLAKPGAGDWLVWDKNIDGMEGEFGDGFELIWTKQVHRREILRHTMVGAADGEKRGGADSTDRPSALYMYLYEHFAGFEGVVCDPWAVGATALLAAEKTGRIYYGAKAKPANVQATLEKWADYSGTDAVEIGSVE